MDLVNGFNKDLDQATAGVAKLAVEPSSSCELGSSSSNFATASETTLTSSIVNADKAKFNELVTQGKEKTRQGDLHGSLELYQAAYKIHKSQKLANRIYKLKEYISENENEEEDDEEDDGMVEVGDGFRLASNVYNALYPYQKNAVLWFWGLYKQKKGGILGDDMGLGKTIQVIAFLSGMFDSDLIKSALIVMPVSVLQNWEKEWKKWSPGIRVKAFHGTSKKDRNRNLEKIQKHDGVCLTTYGMVVSNHETLSQDWLGREFKWDYIILDEGHKIKNTTKTSKNVRAIPADHHFILTGTPVQNNLREMWALFDFVCQGTLLGTSRTFKQEYENPIVRARERDASAYEKRIGNEMSESLRKLIDPHFLRRTKAMVLEMGNKVKTKNASEAEEDKVDSKAKMPTSLTRKNDLIVWLYMSGTQIKIYRDFLGLERVKEILMSSRSPLVELNVLKKITDHPRLLSAMACSQLGLNDGQSLLDPDEDKENMDFTVNSSFLDEHNEEGPSDNTLIKESGKMLFLVKLLDNLKEEGHRCLVFSQSRKMLDIIQRVIKNRGHKILRIDGTISKTAERQRLITTFQKDPSYSCFLLTTQVGGVGITLTAADRVVIFDPSWNPATDAQAVDRVYRIGQKRTVVIYRLITCGTIEEKIYRKQVFKDALMQQTTGSSKNPFRYFTRQDLRDLFTLGDPRKSDTQLQLDKMHSHNRKTDEILDKHINFLHSLNIFGISDHDLMYSQEDVVTEDEMAVSGSSEAIQARVLRAQNMVATESGSVIRAPFGFRETTNPIPFPGKVPENGPIDWARLTAREKVQASLKEFELVKPKREDSKRFLQSGANRRSNPKVSPPEVIDLSTSPKSSSGSPVTTAGETSSVFINLVEEENDSSYAQLEKNLSSLNLSEPDIMEKNNNNPEILENSSSEANEETEPSYNSEPEFYDALNEFTNGNIHEDHHVSTSPLQLSKTVLASGSSEDMSKTVNSVHDYSEVTADDGDTSYSQSSADSSSENGCEPVLKTSTACSPILPNTTGIQPSPTRNETGSTENDDDDSETNSLNISPFVQANQKRSRRQLISSDSESESVADHEDVQSQSSEVEAGFTDSYLESKPNDDRHMTGDELALEKETSNTVCEGEQQSLKYNASYEYSKNNSPMVENPANGNDSRNLGDFIDDDIVFTPRTTKKYHRVKAIFESDDESDDKPVIDRRKSVSRRRSQMVYPSSSDDDDASGHQQSNDIESLANSKESAKDLEISDYSYNSAQSQLGAVTPEEADTNQRSSLRWSSHNFSILNSSCNEDDNPTVREAHSNKSRLPQAKEGPLHSGCPTGDHVSGVVNIFNCPCLTTEEQKLKYNGYLEQGRKRELDGRSEDALWYYLSAINIQDSDLRLHKKILNLQNELHESHTD